MNVTVVSGMNRDAGQLCFMVQLDDQQRINDIDMKRTTGERRTIKKITPSMAEICGIMPLGRQTCGVFLPSMWTGGEASVSRILILAKHGSELGSGTLRCRDAVIGHRSERGRIEHAWIGARS